MSHNLFLGMYSFRIKKQFTKNEAAINNNEFLSNAYPEEEYKFENGFVQDIIKLIDTKTFKNDKNTHGAILENQEFDSKKRTIDLIIDGGITGIKQFIIDESGEKEVLSEKKTVGLKFFARIWLPANSNSGYIFIQKYGTLSIKPIFDSLIKKVIKKNDCSLVNGKLIATTTKKRQEYFMKHSSIKDVIVISKKSILDTNSVQAGQAVIRLRNIKFVSNNIIDREDINKALKRHGFKISGRDYEMKATYENKVNDFKEQKTVVLDDTEETINLIPSIVVPNQCIDKDNYPIFKKMQELVDTEMLQIKKEAKL
jgi:hypothetical protein